MHPVQRLAAFACILLLPTCLTSHGAVETCITKPAVMMALVKDAQGTMLFDNDIAYSCFSHFKLENSNCEKVKLLGVTFEDVVMQRVSLEETYIGASKDPQETVAFVGGKLHTCNGTSLKVYDTTFAPSHTADTTAPAPPRFSYNNFSKSRWERVKFAPGHLFEHDDFSHATVAHATFAPGTELQDEDFYKATIHDTTFTRCMLTENNFSETKFKQVVFHGCTFNSATSFLGSTLDSVKFIDCNFVGETNFLESNLKKVAFANCRFEKLDLSGSTLKNVVFRDCEVASSLDCIEANLTLVYFGNSDPRDDDDNRHALVPAPRRIIANLNLCNTKMKHTRFYRYLLREANFSHTKFNECSFAYCHIPDGNFVRSHHTSTTFTACALQGADYSASKHKKTHFDRGNLCGSQFA